MSDIPRLCPQNFAYITQIGLDLFELRVYNMIITQKALSPILTLTQPTKKQIAKGYTNERL